MVFSKVEKSTEFVNSMDTTFLILEEEYGSRKLINVGLNRQTSEGKLGSGLKSPTGMKSVGKQWVHPQEALSRGHILYNVKFLGECSVDTPKGTEVVKDAIRKMKFNKHIKRAEGQKPPKVELTISIDGLTIQDRVSKKIMHQYPLHRISYCADDKSDKRMFTFIAKAANSNQHNCYVFDSEKCAEEITLTVGQAFDLAYKRFLDTSSKDMDVKKQFLLLQKKVQTLQSENDCLKKRITDLEKLKDRSDVDTYMKQNQITDLQITDHHLDESSTDDDLYSTVEKQSSVGRRLENLLLDTSESSAPHSNGTNGTNISNGTTSPSQSAQATTPILSPPPPSGRTRSFITSPTTPTSQTQTHGNSGNPFSQTPSSGFNGASNPDPFGMDAFNPKSPGAIDQAIKSMDQELMDIQTGFSQGLSFGTDDFSLEDLDPLNHK